MKSVFPTSHFFLGMLVKLLFRKMASARVVNKQISSCKFSPHIDGLVSCSASFLLDPYGPGTVDVFRLTESNYLDPVCSIAWDNAVLDTCWSPIHKDVLIGGCTDNSIQFWRIWDDIHKPCNTLLHHKGPISSVEWKKGGNLLSSALDGSFAVWDADIKQPAVTRKFDDIIIQITASPFTPQLVATLLGQKQLRILDCRSPLTPAQGLVSKVLILSCDWSPHNPNNLLVSTSNGEVANLDLRMVSNFDNGCGVQCHYGPARRARWLPAHNGLAVSGGFDRMTVISDIHSLKIVESILHHSDFVCDVDYSPFHPELLIDCSSDSLLHVFKPRCLIGNKYCTHLQHKL